MLVVDRFEEDKAVVFDDEKQIILDRDKLSHDKANTEQMRNDNLSLLQKLLNK